MTTPNTDDVAQTLAEYERLAIETGARVRIDPPEFWSGLSVDDWAPYWLAENPPVMIRATVHRDDVPTTVYVSWDESLPAEDSWRELWLRKPMKLSGAYAARAALRRAFRDAIGQRREPDEIDPHTPAPAPAVDADAYEAAIAAVQTVEELDALHSKMKRARAVTVPLEKTLRARRRALADAAWTPLHGSLVVEPGGTVKRGDVIAHTETPDAEPEPVATTRPAAPKDHLPPANRAARRARKRGGKR